MMMIRTFYKFFTFNALCKVNASTSYAVDPINCNSHTWEVV
jgi:hypothetical protein